MVTLELSNRFNHLKFSAAGKAMKIKKLSYVVAMLAISMSGSVTADKLSGDESLDPAATAAEEFVPGEIIVGIDSPRAGKEISNLAPSLGGIVKDRIGDTAILLSFKGNKQAEAASKILATKPGVRYVEKNGIMRIPPKPQAPVFDKPGKLGGSDSSSRAEDQDASAQLVSGDPATGYQWHLTVIRKTAPLPALSATPPTVAVIDTGVDWTHPDLSGKVLRGYNAVGGNYYPFDDGGHGTHVAGIIAAKAANGQYGEGVCPNCKILAVKALNAEGSGTWFQVAKAMAWTTSVRTDTTYGSPKVVNMSLGGGYSSTVAAQVLAMKNAGMVLAASAGNSDTSTPSYPGADVNTALRVMATDQHDCRTYFSNYSPSTATTQYNIAAPGWQIPSTVPGARYEPMSGTSMASPVVAGAAALLWGQVPSLTRDGVVLRLLTYGKSTNCGFLASTKRVDVRAAIYAAKETGIFGFVVDPFTGMPPTAPTSPVTTALLAGSTTLKTDPTNYGGAFEMAGLAAGTGRTLKGTKTSVPGYITTNLAYNVAIASGVLTGPSTQALPMNRGTGYATATLDWKTVQPYKYSSSSTTPRGWDFDLYVKTPSGYYIGYGSGDLTSSPFVASGYDSLSLMLPAESVVIAPSAVNGVYHIFADNWGPSYFNPSWTGSMAHAQIFTGSTQRANFNSPPSTCGTNEFWYIGKLTKSGTSYTWTNVNTCSASYP